MIIRSLLLLAFIVSFGQHALAQNADDVAFARLQSQLFEMEERFRQLTGRIEELEYRQRQLEQELREAKLQGNSQQGNAGSTAGEPAQPAPQPLLRESPQPQINQGLREVEPPKPSQQAQQQQPEGVLGTIPRNALLGIEQPQENNPSASAQELAEVTLYGSEADRYAASLDLLRSGDFEAAQVGFNRFIEDYGTGGRASDASYWLAETYFAQGKFANAAEQYAENIRRFGVGSEKSPENFLKLGHSLGRLGDEQSACNAFDQMARRHPDLDSRLSDALRSARTQYGCS